MAGSALVALLTAAVIDRLAPFPAADVGRGSEEAFASGLQQRDPDAANQLSVRLELQADCFAGIYANRVGKYGDVLQAGDAQEAIDAAAAIGDDTLQRSQGRAVVPDSFTHGSSEQRMRWFSAGFKRGSVDDCDTFKAADL